MALQLGALRDAMAGIERRLSVLTWVVVTNLAATVGVLFKLLHG